MPRVDAVKEMHQTLASPELVSANGVEYKANPLTLKQLTIIQKEALKYYKRNFIQTWSENADLLPNSEAMLAEAMNKAARMEISDLPLRTAYDCSKVKLNKKVRELLVGFSDYEDPINASDDDLVVMLQNACDKEQISCAQVKQATGTKPKAVRVPYDAWWATSTYDGMATIIYCSFNDHHPDLTKEEILEWSPDQLIAVSAAVENLSSPDVGN